MALFVKISPPRHRVKKPVSHHEEEAQHGEGREDLTAESVEKSKSNLTEFSELSKYREGLSPGLHRRDAKGAEKSRGLLLPRRRSAAR